MDSSSTTTMASASAAASAGGGGGGEDDVAPVVSAGTTTTDQALFAEEVAHEIVLNVIANLGSGEEGGQEDEPGPPAFSSSPAPPPPPPPPATPKRFPKLRAFVWRQLLAVSLVIAVALGLIWPEPGVLFGTKVDGRSPFQTALVVTIFLVMGLKLNTDAALRAVKEAKGIVWGIFSILFVTASIGAALTNLIDFPDIPEFAVGLVVFYLGPTTSSSGVVMVTTANGNWTLSLLLTVSTSILAIFTIPSMLSWLAEFKTETPVTLDVGELILNLVYTVLIPLFIGKCLQLASARVRRFIKEHPILFRLVPMYCIVLVPWLKVSQSMANGSFDQVTAASVFVLLGWAIAVHVLFLIINYGACLVLRVRRAEMKALVISCSQKTLPVALAVLSFLPETLGSIGLMSIGCVMAHFTQIIIDSFLVGKWAGDEEEEEEKEKGGPAEEEEKEETEEVEEIEIDREGENNSMEVTTLTAKTKGGVGAGREEVSAQEENGPSKAGWWWWTQAAGEAGVGVSVGQRRRRLISSVV